MLNRNLEPQNVLQISEKLKQLILNNPIPKIIIEEIELGYNKLELISQGELWYAVRSSATIEDAGAFSFAGQADTFLFRKTLKEIVNSVKACYASLFSPHALLYIIQMNKLGQAIELKDIQMAVIVQQMIDSDISGVLFTANVLNNNINEMIINSTWGLGEALANNIVIPDTLIIDKSSKETIKTIIGEKEKKTIPDLNHSCTKVVKTDENAQHKCCVTQSHIKKLCEMGDNIEKLYGCPQDIEWAIKNNELFILQSRPITTINKNPVKTNPD